MPRKEYDWTHGPATIEPHSLAKHTILREYVEQYVQILMRRGAIPDLRIALVDGFAGGGEYFVRGQGTGTHDGSPVILINAVDAAKAALSKGRKKSLSIQADFVFVEKNRAAFDHLGGVLERKFDKTFLQRSVKRIHGSFEDQVWRIVADLKSAKGRKPRPIFVLDQYGYSAIPVDMIQRIMGELPSAEIFLTIAVDSIGAYATSTRHALQQVQAALHLEPEARRLSDFVSGERPIEEADDLSEPDRAELMQQIQLVLHETFAKGAGALCYTPFFITSTKSHRAYWFLHLANNARANDVVKNLHWNIGNHFQHHGRVGTRMLVLGVDLKRPPREQLPFDFGDSAMDQTVNALIAELPERLREERFRNGVSLKDLYAVLCNETPASKDILKEAVNKLVGVGELEKTGKRGEERQSGTRLHDGDIVRPKDTGLLFSISELRGKP